MIFPAVLFIFVFLFWPIIQSIILSMQETQWFEAQNYVGLANYSKIFKDSEFWIALKNTAIITAASVPVIVVLATFFSILLNNKLHGITVFRVCFFIPAITILAASTLVWKWIMNGDYGILNYFLSFFGVEPIHWISNPKTSLLLLIIIQVWSALGNNIIILLAGLQNIPTTYYEAAKLDGANVTKLFRHITLPMLSPTLFFIVVTIVIRTLQLFDAPYMLISNSKDIMYDRVGTIIYKYFYESFTQHNIGYGSSVVVTLFGLILIITAIQFLCQKFWVNYD